MIRNIGNHSNSKNKHIHNEAARGSGEDGRATARGLRALCARRGVT